MPRALAALNQVLAHDPTNARANELLGQMQARKQREARALKLRRFSLLGGVKVTGLGMATLENRLPQRCNIALANPALGEADVMARIYDLSFDPYHCPERRWGATGW